MIRAIHQILPTLAYGDAIGNQVLEIKRLLHEWGYSSEIFAEHWHPRLASECRHYEQYSRYSHPDNILILHYSIGGAVNNLALRLQDRLALYYHNITPAEFFHRWNGDMAFRLDQARQGLTSFAGKAPAIVGSTYNQKELEALGFHVIGIAPYILTFEHLDASLSLPGSMKAKHRFAKLETVDWLFVGRIAPNKCIQDVIKSFYYYHRWINPKSRLFLVGTGEGSEAYLSDLYRLVTVLELDGSVIFTGQVESPAVFYGMADVYISLSEHEGFCIPLLEAMHYDVPVIAYAGAAVPETLGNAGVLVHRKEHSVIAELAHEIIINESLRPRILATQRTRLADFNPVQARDEFRQALQSLIEMSAV